jgi:hypothetical protein
MFAIYEVLLGRKAFVEPITEKRRVVISKDALLYPL